MSPFPREAYRPLEPYAPDRRPIAVDLSDNTNRWGTHPAALRIVREADPEDLLRYPPVYADRLKAAVTRRFGVPGESVATGCGSDDLLDSAFRAASDSGGRVRFMEPTFSMIGIFARMNGLEAMPLEREAGMGPEAPFGPLPDPEQLLEGDPDIVYLCRPNNPTGEVLPRGWVARLEEAAGPQGPVILLDEAYVDFMGRGPTGLGRRTAGERSRGTVSGEDSGPGPEVGASDDLLLSATTSDRLVVLRTLSKAYGLAGLRVGFAVGAPGVIREIEKSRGPYKVNRLAEAAAVAALDDEEGWVPGILADVRHERGRLATELEQRDLTPLPSGANFLLVPLSPGSAAHGMTAPDMTAALRERGVAVRPFPDLPGIGEAIRVTVGPRSEMNAFLQALDGILP